MKRTSCSACGSPDLDTFLDLGVSPIADAYTITPDEPSPMYPLQVAVCGKCHLVQLLEVVDDLFGTGYSFYTSASPPLSAYHAGYAADLLTQHRQLVHRGVVEVGCNDGDFLRHFGNYPHLGVDPATGPAAVAAGRGLQVMVEPFGLGAAHEIRDRIGRQGLIVANHVLAHVADVGDMLAGISALLADDGVATVEVQYLPDLLVNNAFDLVYHEHRNFFSFSSLERAANQHGLYARDAVFTNRQGGSLRVTFVKHGWSEGDLSRLAGLIADERWLNSFGAYESMQGRAERIRTRLRELIYAEHEADRTVAMYGAPAKATTLLNFCRLTVDDIGWCVDTTPAKQARHIPGTGIPIVAPNPERPDMFLLAAWNYSRQIMAANGGNRWLIPFPAPVVY